MTGILGGSGSKNATSPTRYQQMNIQTSAQGMCIPIHYGQNRVAPNIGWYGGFTSVPVKQKSGKGGGSSVTSYDYYADVIMLLCEGVVTQVFQVYKGQSSETLASENMVLFEGTVGQAGWSYLQTVYPSQYLNYSGTAYIAVAKLPLGTSPDLPDYSFEIAGNLWGTVPNNVDANPADIMYDYITNAQYGLSPGATWIDPVSLNQYRNYCGAQGIYFSPYMTSQEQVTNTFQRWAQLTNTFIFWSGNQLKFCPLGAYALSLNGYTYTPQIQPIFSLTYDDLLAESRGKEPVIVTRVDPADGYNQVQLDIRDRNNAYNNTSIYWSDPASTSQYGQLMANIVSAPEICLQSIANIAAQLLGQRSVYIRNTYTFKLGYQYCILEPGDIIEINEPNIGLVNFPVRIQAVEEGPDQRLTITAEEFPYSIGQTVLYANETAGNTGTFNTGVSPGNVNPPLIFEPPAALTGSTPQIWLGLSGGQNWGGAEIWVSLDGGNTYTNIGQLETPIIQGLLTATLPSAFDPDTTDTLIVNTTISYSSIPATATNAMADAYQTLAMIDNELIAYGSAVLGSGSDIYDLTYLRRGVYNTPTASHGLGGSVTVTSTAGSGSTVISCSGTFPSVGQIYSGTVSGMPPNAKVVAVSGSSITIDQPLTSSVASGAVLTFYPSVFSRVDSTALFEYTLPPSYIGKKLYFKFTSFNVFGNQTQSLANVSPYTYTPQGLVSPSDITIAQSETIQGGTTFSTFGGIVVLPGGSLTLLPTSEVILI